MVTSWQCVSAPTEYTGQQATKKPFRASSATPTVRGMAWPLYYPVVVATRFLPPAQPCKRRAALVAASALTVYPPAEFVEHLLPPAMGVAANKKLQTCIRPARAPIAAALCITKRPRANGNARIAELFSLHPKGANSNAIFKVPVVFLFLAGVLRLLRACFG